MPLLLIASLLPLALDSPATAPLEDAGLRLPGGSAASLQKGEVKEQRPPSSRELKELLAALLAVDAHKIGGRAAIDELLEPYAGLAAPEGSKRKKLIQAIDKAWGKGPELPTKTGEHFDLDGNRGRYFIEGALKRPKGLFIGLHGGGLGSADASGSRNAYRAEAKDRGWAAIFPQALEATEHGWTDSGTEPWIMGLIERARRTYGVPPDRIFIGGHSMGGYGSWVLGAHHADLFAAAVPSAGAPSPVYNGDGSIHSIQSGVIPNLRNLPMCVFQSTDDPRVPPEVNQAAVKEIERAKKRWGGYDQFTYWEVDDRGHSYPEGGTDALLARIDGFERNALPERIVWQPMLPWKTQFYWLDWPKPRQNALIVATFDAATRTFDIETDGRSIEGMGILLREEMLPLGGEVVVNVDGEERYRGQPTESWGVLVRTSLTSDPGRRFTARIDL